MSAIIGIFAGASIATARTELYLIMIERSGSVASPTTRRSIKNIVFNLAQRVSGAYMRFHNDICLRCDGACARDAGSTTPRRLPPFPRQFDKLVRENFTRQRRKREKERKREHISFPRECELTMGLRRIYLRHPTLLPCKSLSGEKSVLPQISMKF